MAKIIFFGNGPLADYTLSVLKQSHQIIFHAHTKEDLVEVIKIKQDNPKAYGVLASFGVIIKSELLELFEPTGILNIHPSKLPEYRGPTPIETAMLAGNTSYSVSVMKLVPAMDAGPIYFQATHQFDSFPTKDSVYYELATLGANWLAKNLEQLPTPVPQDDSEATYTAKFSKADSPLDPTTKSAASLQYQINAFAGFPKSTYQFSNLNCIIHAAHISDTAENQLSLKCADDKYLVIDTLQPAGRKIMDAKSFINGYLGR